MAWQQRMDAMRATRVDRTAVGGLIIGGLLGLALGLLIGWVWWPVEWQGSAGVATPAAATTEFSSGSQFDDVTTRSLFLGATADAYVYSIAQGNRDAAAVATQRLAALGGDLPGAFDEAIAFYDAQPAAAAQVTNLTTLATAVGITPGSSATTPTAAPAAAAGEAAGAPAAQTGATLVAGGTAQGGADNMLGWVLSLLAAIALIGGGVFLLLRLNRGGDMEASSVGPGGTGGGNAAFDDEVPPSGPPSVPAFDRSALSPMHATVAPAASVRSPIERPVAVTGHDPHGFEDDEDDEDAYAPTGGRTVSAYRVGAADDEYTRAAAGEPQDETDDWIDDDLEDEEGAEGAGENSEIPAADAKAPPAAPPAEPPPTRSNLGGTSVRTPPPPTLQPPTPSRFERYQPIDNFTYTYSLGQVDTDKGRHIGAPVGDGYLGEYSVGIPQKNGLLDHDMLKPIAMEVVLFEKSDVRSTLTTTRLLLSTYADDHLREEYKRANPNLSPIVAQPNTRFQLEGNELLLDVLIREVNYTREGFFQNVALDLAVKRKT